MNNHIRPAATIVVCDQSTGWPYSVLLLKRSEKSAFLPGAYVFPGGRIDTEDYGFADFLAKDQAQAERICQHFSGNHRDNLAYLAAGIRECFEETGLFILPLKKLGLVNNLTWSKANQGNFISTHTPCLDNLWPISWWVTPKGESRRYNTLFFLGLLPEAKPITLGSELCASLWIKPDEALFKFTQQEIFLAPPTRTILERMRATKSLADFLSYVDKPLRPIAPFFVEEEGKKILVLPGDTLHPQKDPLLLPLYTRYQF